MARQFVVVGLGVDEWPPARDAYGRFALLTLPLELSPRDAEHWPPETRVLFDAHFERGETADASYSIIDSSNVAAYRMEHVKGAKVLPVSPLDWVEPWCPWRRFKEWPGEQEQIPVALYRQAGEIGRSLARPILMTGTPRNDDIFRREYLRRWLDEVAPPRRRR